MSQKKSKKDLMPKERWTFLTNHSHVLYCLSEDSELVLREIADRVGITERSVQRIVRELEQEGFLEKERVGRRNRYRLILKRELRHELEKHTKIEDIIKVLRGSQT